MPCAAGSTKRSLREALTNRPHHRAGAVNLRQKGNIMNTYTITRFLAVTDIGAAWLFFAKLAADEDDNQTGSTIFASADDVRNWCAARNIQPYIQDSVIDIVTEDGQEVDATFIRISNPMEEPIETISFEEAEQFFQDAGYERMPYATAPAPAPVETVHEDEEEIYDWAALT